MDLLLRLGGFHFKHLRAVVRAAIQADVMRTAWLVALWTFHQCRHTQGEMAAAAVTASL
jgi:hypothetical protein